MANVKQNKKKWNFFEKSTIDWLNIDKTNWFKQFNWVDKFTIVYY